MTPSDVKIVADNINDFIEAPDGLTRLRRALLTLAMSGNLVPQIENEGTAEDLLVKIQVQRKKVFERKKKNSDSIPLSAEEIPFSIPESWKWVRINEIGQVVGGGTPSTSKSSYFTEPTSPEAIPWLSPADMRKQRSMYVSHGRQSLTADGYKNSSATLMPKGSVIFSSRAPIGYVGIASNPLSTNQGFKSTVPYEGICSEYVYWYLLLRADDINNRAPGTTFKEISGTSFAKEVFALPPTSEQKRIVDKVEEVMQQFDELEVKKIESDEIRTRLTRSAMQALGSADSKVAFEQLNELITTPQDVNELESAILNLAVTGKLTDQDVKEGNAVDLMQDILKIKQELINLKKLKSPKQNNIPLTIRDFNLPENWTWVKGDEVFFITKLAGFEYTEHIKLSDIGDVPVIRAQNVRKYNIDRSSLKYISSEVSALLNRSALTKPCLLVTFIGAGIGEVALFDEEIRWHLAPNVAKMELFENCDSILNLKYFNYYLASGYGQREIFKHMKETAQPSLSMGTIRDIDYPLPPTEEQNRIVKKVEELMCLMNQLRKVIG